VPYSQSDPLFFAIVEACPDAVLVADDEGRYVAANAAASVLTGFSREELLERSVWDLTPAPNRELGFRLWQAFITAGRQDGEYTLVRKDGATILADYRAVAGVRPGRHFVFMRDLTPRLRAEEALRQSEARFRLVADSTPVLIWMADPDNKGTYFNRRWTEYTGLSLEESCGDGWLRAIHPDDAEVAAAYCGKHVEARRPFTMEFRLRRADGAYRWMLDSGVPLIDSDGTFRGLIGSCVDIEDHKQAELERELRFRHEQDARAAAEAANRTKDEFLATLSHELRTPLNVVLGYTSMLRRGAVRPERLASTYDAVDRNARLQLRLVSDLLDVSSAAAGKLTLARTVVDVRRLVGAALDTIKGDGRAAHLASALLEPAEDEVLVLADESRLAQVIENLLANAVKFTPDGGRVEAAVGRTADDQVTITVRDTGVGIAPAFLPHVFTRFSQADTSPSRTTGGLGLGLTIVRQVVELHGGRVEAASDGPGLGATFTVWLPAYRGEPSVALT
jgi:PAS domain S-box-containing protein